MHPPKAGKSVASYLIVLVRWIGVYALLNAPFWWWGAHDFISRPLFNVELVVPALLIAWSRPLGYAGLVVVWLLDGLVSQSATFYFTSPLDFIRSIQFLGNLGWREYLSWERLLILMPFVVAAWILPRLVGHATRGWWIGVALPVLIAALDVLNGSSMFSNRAIRLVDANIAGSPSVTMLVRISAAKTTQPLQPLDAVASTRAMVDIAQWARAHPSRSAVMILVESFGVHKDPIVQAWLQRQVWSTDLADRYRKLDGRVPFHGSTTNGELRELCSMAGSYRTVGESERPLPCLPQSIDELGWSTIGLHGFSQAMFLRSLWWPKTGLQRMEFAEQLLSPEAPRCGGAFAGACDADVIAEAFDIVRSPKEFAYVLTLNSHLPLKAGPIDTELAGICANRQIEKADCQFLSTIGVMLHAVRQGLQSAPRSNLPMVVLVGDHAPPFADRRIRERYSQTQVQAFAFIPLN